MAALALRILLSLTLIAGGLTTPAALAMSLAPAPGDTAASGADRPACHGHTAPAKKGPQAPPCCAGGKCPCSINGPGLPVTIAAAAPAAAPVRVAHRGPSAAPPPLLADLLRPPIG